MCVSIPRYRGFSGTYLPDNPAFLYDLVKVNKVFFFQFELLNTVIYTYMWVMEWKQRIMKTTTVFYDISEMGCVKCA